MKGNHKAYNIHTNTEQEPRKRPVWLACRFFFFRPHTPKRRERRSETLPPPTFSPWRRPRLAALPAGPSSPEPAPERRKKKPSIRPPFGGRACRRRRRRRRRRPARAFFFSRCCRTRPPWRRCSCCRSPPVVCPRERRCSSRGAGWFMHPVDAGRRRAGRGERHHQGRQTRLKHKMGFSEDRWDFREGDDGKVGVRTKNESGMKMRGWVRVLPPKSPKRRCGQGELALRPIYSLTLRMASITPRCRWARATSDRRWT